MRVHRNWLVNGAHIKEFERDGHETKLFVGAGVADAGRGVHVPVARERAGALREMLLMNATGLRRRRSLALIAEPFAIPASSVLAYRSRLRALAAGLARSRRKSRGLWPILARRYARRSALDFTKARVFRRIACGITQKHLVGKANSGSFTVAESVRCIDADLGRGNAGCSPAKTEDRR